LKFPIIQIYSKLARFNAVQFDRDHNPKIVAKNGSGFFYNYNGNIFFVTDRDYIIIEEKAFLPDSIIIHQNNLESQTKNAPLIEGIEISLYDQNEKPLWKVLPVPKNEERMLVSIPIPQDFASQRNISTESFVSAEQLPKEVFLPINKEQENSEEYSLSLPVSVGLSLADYFLYSDKSNAKKLQKKIERYYQHSYQDHVYDQENQIIDVSFKIHRKNFAQDMIEMVLVLLEKNMDGIRKLTDNQNMPSLQEKVKSEKQTRISESEDLSELLQTHFNLTRELENILYQFRDVLEPSIFDRINTVFKLMSKQDKVTGLLQLIKNESDYLVVKHLIHKILDQMGRNIGFVQS